MSAITWLLISYNCGVFSCDQVREQMPEMQCKALAAAAQPRNTEQFIVRTACLSPDGIWFPAALNSEFKAKP